MNQNENKPNLEINQNKPINDSKTLEEKYKLLTEEIQKIRKNFTKNNK